MVTLAKPTAEQAAWQDFELGMMIHFDIPWYHRDYETRPSPEIFNPKKLDTGQWMEAAKGFGAKYAVLTATHGTGFMLWQSDAYPFGVKQSPWRGGKGDVVKDFVTSCRETGIAPGLYSHMLVNGYWEVDHPGLTNRGKGDDPAKQAEYVKSRIAALKELWRNYGPLTEVWFDGGTPDPVLTGMDVIPLLKQLQPKAIVFQSPVSTIRWVGNEEGVADYPCWASVPSVEEAMGWEKIGRNDLLRTGVVDGGAWLPGECDVAIRKNTWMWEPNTEDRLFSLEHLMKIYYKSVGRNCNLLLNANPDRDGLIPEPDMQRCREFSAEINRRFGKSIAEKTGKGNLIELAIDKPTVIDHVIIMEQITEGERIREYIVEGLVDNNWQPLCSGQSVGHKRIEQFPPVKVSGVRLNIKKSAAEPLVRKFAVYFCNVPMERSL